MRFFRVFPQNLSKGLSHHAQYFVNGEIYNLTCKIMSTFSSASARTSQKTKSPLQRTLTARHPKKYIRLRVRRRLFLLDFNQHRYVQTNLRPSFKY